MDPVANTSVYAAQDARDSGSPEGDGQTDTSKPKKHRRNYQACEPCRERKVKCDLGDVDNPTAGPCKKCAREQKKCVFRETRKKEGSNKDEIRPVKRARVDSNVSAHGIDALPQGLQVGQSMPYNSSPLSPQSQFPSTSPGILASPLNQVPYSQPRSTPGSYMRSNSGYSNTQIPAGVPYNSANAAPRTSNGDDHVVMPQANSLAASFTNTTDNMNVLIRAATTTEAGMNSPDHVHRTRALTGSASEIDMKKLNPRAAKSRMEGLNVWNQMKFVRAGWLSADEGMQHVEYFYTHLAHMTPVVTQDFRDPATHRRLLTEEPILALAILAITSRYYELKTESSITRGIYLHEKLWNSLRNIVQRLLWGQEQFGGGFTGAGMVPTQETATGQITWKGSLRTLGTIEALLLLTDWQPRALHFPPGDDENKLVGASVNLLDEEKPAVTEDTFNLPYSKWLEPAWRSDRMSWMLLGLAQSLSFELGVFDTRHEFCRKLHGPDSECMRKRRIRRLVITYVAQVSGRIGIQSTLSPDQDHDSLGPDSKDPVTRMQKMWFDISSIMFDANREIFPSREETSRLVASGRYGPLILQTYTPRLNEWLNNFSMLEQHLHPTMRAVLRMEYEYARLYINSLGLQRVVGHIANQNRKTFGTELVAQLEENKVFIDEVRGAARKILECSCYELGNVNALYYSPVRTFLRTLSGLMFSLKLLSLGSEERMVRATFKLLKEMTKRMTEQVVDDVHLSPHTAKLIQQLMVDVNRSMVRIPKPQSRGQSRQLSPQLPNGQNGNIAGYAVSDQESPDSLAQLPLADFTKQSFMPVPGFDNPGTYDANFGIDTSVDPALFGNEDWISMPIDPLFDADAGTVNQGYGGIGPTFGDRDMLSLITGSHLDQNQGFGGAQARHSNNYMGFGNGY